MTSSLVVVVGRKRKEHSRAVAYIFDRSVWIEGMKLWLSDSMVVQNKNKETATTTFPYFLDQKET